MSEPKVDRRVQRTRDDLHQALLDLVLEKRYDKITIQDIIDRANVGRSTFYSHFLDKEDLLAKGLQLLGEDLHTHAHLEDTEPGTEHVLHSLTFFEHAYTNRDLYRAVLNGGGRDFLLAIGREHLLADIHRHVGEVPVNEQHATITPEVLAHFVAGAMMSILTWWVESSMPIPPREVNAMFHALASPSVDAFFAGRRS